MSPHSSSFSRSTAIIWRYVIWVTSMSPISPLYLPQSSKYRMGNSFLVRNDPPHALSRDSPSIAPHGKTVAANAAPKNVLLSVFMPRSVSRSRRKVRSKVLSHQNANITPRRSWRPRPFGWTPPSSPRRRCRRRADSPRRSAWGSGRNSRRRRGRSGSSDSRPS